MPSSRVTGHALRQEGRAFTGRGCEEGPCASGANAHAVRGWDGHGECSCGAQSPHLTAQRARQAWHREHKAGVVLPEAKAGQRYRSKDGSGRVIELVRWDPLRRDWQARSLNREHGERRHTSLLPETLRTRYELLPGQPQP